MGRFMIQDYSTTPQRLLLIWFRHCYHTTACSKLLKSLSTSGIVCWHHPSMDVPTVSEGTLNRNTLHALLLYTWLDIMKSLLAKKLTVILLGHSSMPTMTWLTSMSTKLRIGAVMSCSSMGKSQQQQERVSKGQSVAHTL